MKVRLWALFILVLTILLGIAFIGDDEGKSVESASDEFEKKEVEFLPKDTTPDFIRIDNLPSNFDTVPGGNNVFRSNQPSIKQLKNILESYDINTVVRMNGKESTGISVAYEKSVVESMGKEFIWVNAHINYVKDSGYVGSIEKVQPYLHKGNVLIHCTAGADRTGYQVARYLKDKFDWDEKRLWEYTTQYNHWEKFICQGKSGYIKYMEAFYTMDDWCEDFGQDCYICK